MTYFAIVSQTRMTVVLKEFEVQGGNEGTDKKKKKIRGEGSGSLAASAAIFQEDINLSSFLLWRTDRLPGSPKS